MCSDTNNEEIKQTVYENPHQQTSRVKYNEDETPQRYSKESSTPLSQHYTDNHKFRVETREGFIKYGIYLILIALTLSICSFFFIIVIVFAKKTEDILIIKDLFRPSILFMIIAPIYLSSFTLISIAVKLSKNEKKI